MSIRWVLSVYLMSLTFTCTPREAYWHEDVEMRQVEILDTVVEEGGIVRMLVEWRMERG